MRKVTLLAAGLLFSTSWILSGCTNLGAVRDISTRLTDASTSWGDVAADVAASCERERTINSAIENCNLPARASSGIAGANSVLENYFKALASAANESNFTIQPGLDAATSSVSGIPGIKEDQVAAVSSLGGLLAGLVTEKMREDALRDLIDRGAPPARTVVRALDELVVHQMTERLTTERVQLTAQFARLIGQQHDRVGPSPELLCTGSTASTFSGTGFLLTIEYCRRLAVVDRRFKALTAYSESLKAAETALAELQSAKTRLKSADLAKRLHTIGSELDGKVAAVRKAFA